MTSKGEERQPCTAPLTVLQHACVARLSEKPRPSSRLFVLSYIAMEEPKPIICRTQPSDAPWK